MRGRFHHRIKKDTNMKKLILTTALAAVLFSPSLAEAHARAGARAFPATLAVDDPGVSDELNLPQVNSMKEDGGGRETEYEFGASKRLTDTFGLEAEGAWVDSDEADGFDNFGVGAKYVFATDAAHEFIASAGLDWDIGGSGASRIGEKSSTVTPAFYFGKGMGDLPSSMKMLKPFAVTGQLGVGIPTDRHDEDGETIPNTLEWGGTLQYSVPYLQSQVKDFGISGVLATAVPVVEFAMETPLNGPEQKTTGTINPGVIFMGQGVQFGLEAQIPATSASGDGVGVRAQLHFYLDDLMPTTWGKPVW